MKTVYIAGPFRAPTTWGIENNIREAERWGLEVAKLGAVPVIPHAMYRFFHGTLTDEFWLEATLALLQSCNGLLVIDDLHGPRWLTSQGTIDEVYEMERRLGRHVFFLDDLRSGKLENWIKEGT